MLDLKETEHTQLEKMYSVLGERAATEQETQAVLNLLTSIPGLPADNLVAHTLRHEPAEFPGQYPLVADFSTGAEAKISVSVRRAFGTTQGGLQIKFTREEKLAWGQTTYELNYTNEGHFNGASFEHEVFVDGDVQYNGVSINEDGEITLVEGPLFEQNKQSFFLSPFPVYQVLDKLVARETLDKPFNLQSLSN